MLSWVLQSCKRCLGGEFAEAANAGERSGSPQLVASSVPLFAGAAPGVG